MSRKRRLYVMAACRRKALSQGGLLKSKAQAIGWCVTRSAGTGLVLAELLGNKGAFDAIKVGNKNERWNCSRGLHRRIVFGEESSLIRETVKKAVSENNRIVLNWAK